MKRASLVMKPAQKDSKITETKDLYEGDKALLHLLPWGEESMHLEFPPLLCALASLIYIEACRRRGGGFPPAAGTRSSACPGSCL